jgi:phosphoribosylformimino-5-aminoimidazole carboxamide ribotide isomerase
MASDHFPLLPVIDLLGGQVVHARRGERHLYQPLHSRLTSSCQPLEVAAAFRQLGFNSLYVADLDALAGRQPDLATYTHLAQVGFQLWLDAGIRAVEQALRVQQAGAAKVILALETLPTPALIPELLQHLGAASLVFSLDLRQGIPQKLPAVWPGFSAVEIATEVIQWGVQQLLLLDVAQVGTGQGTGTAELCWQLHQRFPDVTLITGGGIWTREDVAAQVRLGASLVLAATALHEGTLP